MKVCRLLKSIVYKIFYLGIFWPQKKYEVALLYVSVRFRRSEEELAPPSSFSVMLMLEVADTVEKYSCSYLPENLPEMIQVRFMVCVKSAFTKIE